MTSSDNSQNITYTYMFNIYQNKVDLKRLLFRPAGLKLSVVFWLELHYNDKRYWLKWSEETMLKEFQNKGLSFINSCIQTNACIQHSDSEI